MNEDVDSLPEGQTITAWSTTVEMLHSLRKYPNPQAYGYSNWWFRFIVYYARNPF